MNWRDFEKTSVLNLHAPGAVVDDEAHTGPRLVVSLDDDGRWRGFAVTGSGTTESVATLGTNRSEAKAKVITETLRLLSTQDPSVEGHAELMAVQPMLEKAAA